MFSRKPDQAVADRLTSMGPGRAFSYACDVQSEEQIARVGALIAEQEPDGIHVLVNNAGATWGEPFDTTPKK